MNKIKPHQHKQQASLFEEMEEKNSISDILNLSEPFPTDYISILHRIEKIDAPKYARTRNFLNGAVTYLSPYIARGIVSLPQIKEVVMKNKKLYQVEKLMQELAWREYFQRIGQFYGDTILSDIKHPQPQVQHHQIPVNIVNATTQVDGIDAAINTLYQTGYMHNHARMYTAMLACNIAKSHWYTPAKWLYYHLLDGDIASNMLSWQWVAGSFSNKKYFANQENISKYTGSNQSKGYLANEYEVLATMDVPEALQQTVDIQLTTALPSAKKMTILPDVSTFIYNSYNIDCHWHSNKIGNRILLLEPSHFAKYPISEKVLNWIIQLAKDNIPTLQIFVGEFDDLMALLPSPLETVLDVRYKEHPTTQHYKGNKESRDWMFPEVEGNFNSFFAYWKKCEKYLR